MGWVLMNENKRHMHVSLTDFSHALLFVLCQLYRASCITACFTDWKQPLPVSPLFSFYRRTDSSLSLRRISKAGNLAPLLFPCVFSPLYAAARKAVRRFFFIWTFLNYDLQFIVCCMGILQRNRMAWILTILFERTYGKGMACPCQYRYHLVSLALSLFLSKWHEVPLLLLHRLYRRKLCIWVSASVEWGNLLSSMTYHFLMESLHHLFAINPADNAGNEFPYILMTLFEVSSNCCCCLLTIKAGICTNCLRNNNKKEVHIIRQYLRFAIRRCWKWYDGFLFISVFIALLFAVQNIAAGNPVPHIFYQLKTVWLLPFRALNLKINIGDAYLICQLIQRYLTICHDTIESYIIAIIHLLENLIHFIFVSYIIPEHLCNTNNR